MFVYSRAEVEVSNIILKSFRRGERGIILASPISKRTSKKPTQIRFEILQNKQEKRSRPTCS